MAGLMTASMLLIELPLMRHMYPRNKLNGAIMGFGIVALASCFLFIRQQIAISDGQFLRSMIPHHASAILMCEQAALSDLEIRELCENIVTSQQVEIEQMKAMLAQPAQ